MRILLDTNVLLRHSIIGDPQHDEVLESIARARGAGRRPCMAPQNLYEFWGVATRPVSVNGYGLSPDETAQHLGVLRGLFELLPDPPDLLDRWLDLCVRYDVKGAPAHDARLVAVMLAHGTTDILTLNPDDFARYGEVVCLAPGDV